MQYKYLFFSSALLFSLAGAMETIVTPEGQVFKKYISSSEIQSRVKEIGSELTNRYRGKNPVVLGVLKGAALFMSDLVKEMPIECELDYLRISSYGAEQHSSGTVKLLDNFTTPIKNRDVIIVEDIVDTGLSMNFLHKLVNSQSPSSICIVTLLKKNIQNKLTVPLDYVGFHIPQEFVIGYGLDLAGKYRNIPAIYKA